MKPRKHSARQRREVTCSVIAALLGLALLIGVGLAYWAPGDDGSWQESDVQAGAESLGADGVPGAGAQTGQASATGALSTVAAPSQTPPVSTRQQENEPAPMTPTATLTPEPAPPETDEASAGVETEPSGSSYPMPVDEAIVEAILEQMSLEQKTAQMLMVGLPTAMMDEMAWRRVAQQQVGGVIFLEKNTESAQQVASFTDALQSAAMAQSPGLPLFIGWNHEGGTVVRRRAQVTAFPSAMAVGAANRPALAYEVGRAMADEMRSLGVNMNFGPVLDVNSEAANPVIGLRAFGDNPGIVADMGLHTIAGLQDAGVIAVAKHFPGHGAVDVDSHLDLPLLSADFDQLYTRELLPFLSAVEAAVGGVMVAHLQIPALDPGGWASSLSPLVIETILRQQLGYDGVVMTDDIGMGAIANHYTLEQATVQAVLAGNDLLLSVETSSYPDRMHNALVQAVLDGHIPLERIDQAVRRIIRLKLAYNLSRPQDAALLANQAAHQELAARVGREAVTVLQDAPRWLPLQLSDRRLLLVTPATMHAGTASGDGLSLLGELLAARGVAVQEIFYYPDAPWSVGVAQAEAQAAAANAGAVVLLTWNAGLRQAQQGDTAQETMVRALLADGQSRQQPVIVAFSQLPYDSLRVAEAPVQVAMYGDMFGQLQGLVGLLLGE